MRINKELSDALQNQQEEGLMHTPYDQELNFYAAVQAGNTEEVYNLMTPLTKEGLGILSRQPLKNLQYHLVISIALITRFCIEGGLEQEVAYSLSDLFIRKTDLCVNEQEITKLHKTMILEFTNRMALLPKNKAKSKPVVMCLNYIHQNYHAPVALEQLSEYTGLNASYLSTLFKKEMGITIFQYILDIRLEGAKNMLKYSDYTYAAIGNYFGFSSQSHFTYNFRTHVGLTPKQYRDRYYSSNWKE